MAADEHMDADLFGEPAPAPELPPDEAAPPPELDLFEAAVRLREALAEDDGGGRLLTNRERVIVEAADLAAVLDAPGRYALTDEAVRRAFTAWNRTAGQDRHRLDPYDAPQLREHYRGHADAMRAAIAAALSADRTT